jgi:hypothetical protein
MEEELKPLEEIGLINLKTSKEGGEEQNRWKRTAFTVNDKVFSTFDTQLGEEFNEGDLVKIYYKIKDKFNNILDMEDFDGEVPKAVPMQKPIQKEEVKSKDWTEDIIDFDTLLADAHKKGLTGIKTELISLDLIKKDAVFRAEVTGFIKNDKGDIITTGVFTAYGDATNENIKSAMIKPHFIRMAETRAISRALRFYTNNAEHYFKIPLSVRE